MEEEDLCVIPAVAVNILVALMCVKATTEKFSMSINALYYEPLVYEF